MCRGALSQKGREPCENRQSSEKVTGKEKLSSWIITSEKQNVVQTAYHITVAGPNGVLWDSGLVESNASTFIGYGGEVLPSMSDISWTVEVWDNTGDMARSTHRRNDQLPGKIAITAFYTM